MTTAPALAGAAESATMNQLSNDLIKEARQKGVRRTALVVGAIAVALFLLSILQGLNYSNARLQSQCLRGAGEAFGLKFPARLGGGGSKQEKSTGTTMGHQQDAYFVPAKSYWPIVASVVMFVTVFGAAHWLNAPPGEAGFGKTMLTIGFVGILLMFFGWFRTVIRESIAGNYNKPGGYARSAWA